MQNERRGRLNESGQGMSEYLILVMLISVASIAASRSVGKTVSGKLKQIHSSLEKVTIESVTEGSEKSDQKSNAVSQGSSFLSGFGSGSQ
jgi:Flp pilus assembly pilin Flp